METAASNFWRQPVNGYLSSNSSVNIDWIQGKKINTRIYIYIDSGKIYMCICIYLYNISTANTVDYDRTFYFPSVASHEDTHKTSTASHWLGSWYVESWKSHRLFQITKVFSLIVSEVKSEKCNIYNGTIGSCTLRSPTLIIQSGMHFYLPLSEHSSSSAVMGTPGIPWAGILNASTRDCAQAELCTMNLGSFHS